MLDAEVRIGRSSCRKGQPARVNKTKQHTMNAKQNQSSASLMHRLYQGRSHPEIHEPPAGVPPDRHSPSQHTLKRILLADDDPGIREMLGKVLESERYEVILAKNGNEAATKSVASEPDLVLLDLNMPERDGWSAFRFLDTAHPLIPVIIITARPNQSTHAEELGVDALMEKPLNLPVLLEAIEDLLAETEAERTSRLTNPEFKTALLNLRSEARAWETVR
jgi:two-component system, cell cycle response regulator DivK